MADLLINGLDAKGLGVYMGNGFLDAIDCPLEIKERIVSESRQEDGMRVVATPVLFKSRSLNLEFIIIGSGNTLQEQQQNYRDRRNAFLKLVYESAPLTLQVPAISNDIYRVYYSAKTPTYGMNRKRTLGKIAMKFDEPNPKDRGVKPL